MSLIDKTGMLTDPKKLAAGIQLDAVTSAAPSVNSQMANASLAGITNSAVQGAKNLVAKPKAKPAAAKTGGAATGAGAAQTGPSYMDQLNSLYDQIIGRGPFQYDLNGDMLYRQMADQYTQMGRLAMRDATGTAAGLTGGYGNSYANQVGNQQYQQYLTALNNNIPAFYDRAREAWDDETARLAADYETVLAHMQNMEALKPKGSAGGDAKKTGAGDTSLWDKLWQQVQTGATQRQILLDLAKNSLIPQTPYYDELHAAEKEKRK